MKQPFNALLIGRYYPLAWALPSLLVQAGFHVDIITSSSLLRFSRFIRHYDWLPLRAPLFPVIAQRIKHPYDWIIVTEDQILKEILDSPFSLEEKLKLLPVQKEKDFSHLYSKIGLSRVFQEQGIKTPPFSVAQSREQAIDAASALAYPILIKKDASGGGSGVFECKNIQDFQKIPKEIFEEPVLVQKKIKGIEKDLSALYLEGHLIHFSHSEPTVYLDRFGPSSLRTYTPLNSVEPSLFEELRQVGKALGANGFTNMSVIQQIGGDRFYFEADMRPNVWVNIPRFFGEDLSLRIREWFMQRKELMNPVFSFPAQTMQIPYFLRLRRWELLTNRYRVWNFIPKEDRTFLILLLLRKLFFIKLKQRFIFLLKTLISSKYHPFLRKQKKYLKQILGR